MTRPTVLPPEELFPDDSSTDAPEPQAKLLSVIEQKAPSAAATIATANLKLALPPSVVDSRSAMSIKIPRKVKVHDHVDASTLPRMKFDHREDVYK